MFLSQHGVPSSCGPQYQPTGVGRPASPELEPSDMLGESKRMNRRERKERGERKRPSLCGPRALCGLVLGNSCYVECDHSTPLPEPGDLLGIQRKQFAHGNALEGM